MNAMKTLLAVLMAGLISMPAFAHDNDNDRKKRGNDECPVGLVSGLTMDDEFGPGTQDLTHCIKKRHDVKMVVQINQFCTNAATPESCAASPYGLGNIRNILDDYEITHGMKPGKDYEMVVVLHSPGGRMALKDTHVNGAGNVLTNRNPFEQTIRGLMARGVKFYFCQNTTRAFLGNGLLPRYLATGISATDQMIEGIEYTTAGLTSIADFQARGYQYIQP
jgi:intracellular sulfur oxidation DsrE/DsrF family protein